MKDVNARSTSHYRISQSLTKFASESRTSIDGPGICRFTTKRDRFMPSAGMQWGRKQSVILNGQL